MTDSRKVVFVNRFYWPEEPATAQLLTDLAEALAADGIAVQVITSRQTPDTPLLETRRGVSIHRVPSSRFGKNTLIGRAIDFFTFSLGALRLLSRTLKSGDTLVNLTDPPLLGMGSSWVAKKRGARVVHWIQDIYPEIPLTLGKFRALSVVKRWRDRAWRSADACVAPGTDMAAFVTGRGVAPSRVVVCPNWAPLGLTARPLEAGAALRESWNLKGKFVVAYSGNLGRVHELAPIVEIAALLRDQSDIQFTIIGGGAQLTALKTRAGELRLSNIQFHPAQSRDELAATLACANLHLVTLREGCERFVFPSKLYGIAAIGRPVLFIGPPHCEVAQLILAHGFGEAYSPKARRAAAQAIIELRKNPAREAAMGRAALQFQQEFGSFNRAVAVWRDLLVASKPLAVDLASVPPSP